jgi:N-methylhydantoinase B/oxoprolinase/acetone carboxylase alpha subunit
VDRPVEAVLRDVRDELLSVEEALDVYGVTVDLEALTATRNA